MPETEKKKEPKFGDIIKKIKTVKHIDIIIVCIVVAIMLFIYFSSCSTPESENQPKEISTSDYCSMVVEELESKLSLVNGAGRVTVLINWLSGEEQIPAYSTGSSGSETIVTVGGKIYILKTIYPEPKGIIIICDGANNISTKVNLISAVSSYFGIDENKITVLARTK